MYRIVRGLLELTYLILLLDLEIHFLYLPPEVINIRFLHMYPVHYNERANFFTCRIANMWNDYMVDAHCVSQQIQQSCYQSSIIELF